MSMAYNIEVYRKEVPPISVRELAHELEILEPLVNKLVANDPCIHSGEVYGKILARLRPELLKTLVLIAQKETTAVLDSRKKVRLTQLGNVRIVSPARPDTLEWVDILLTEDRVPLLRRVSLSKTGIQFHAFSWAGWASISCGDLHCWDGQRHAWAWDSADCCAAAEPLRDGVLPHIPLRMAAGDTVVVLNWARHLEYCSVSSLMEQASSMGGSEIGTLETEHILHLLQQADADLNPLWAHLLHEGQWE